MARTAGRRRRRGAGLQVSRLTLTIFLANLAGLAVLLFGSFGLTQFRDGLIQAKLEGVRAQAQIIADVLAQTAIDETSCRPMEAGEAGPGEAGCALALNEGDVNQIFTRVWDSFEGRVRIFNAPQSFSDPPVTDAGALLLEDVVLRRDVIIVEELAPIDASPTEEFINEARRRLAEAFGNFLAGGYRREAARRALEDELNEALASSPFAEERGATSLRLNEDGELVASVSVPIRKVQAIYGIVTAEIGGIDELVLAARLAILPFFGLACLTAILSAFLLTAAIAQPIRQLALAAHQVREGVSAAGRVRIPDLTARRDEIGELSAALRSMTQAVYDRMEAIETFAADVAHELKNPLTSIRSAAETLEIAKDSAAREKLMALIKKDVARMNRLITDISNASRLDAELARQTHEPVELRKLIADIGELYAATLKDGEARVRFDAAGPPVYVSGNPTALSQVFRNLIDNARSFSPPNGEVRVFLEPAADREARLRVLVEDDGPGVPPDALEKIFTRFYTKRPSGSAFGNNSGLGLAICRQIVASHGGRIWAENRLADPANPEGPRLGARFVVELPAA
ncbi:ATP-binding protein [Amphiplicatus metriothermophilus]|uniref:histidine kinase n=1 Tax=Amphiplicatus metriothermophilus TaxID=1519374 RepID=A0A239PKP3_9PROT|nr:ATP-binding protein [Amphiplicatus metriothermophilus]MBB5518042.1 two-component system sensor histidine kinase ChvG [Amphiplicatus metriothermophilus]SNT67624.1 two-component system, OmpR family, sensor histidine kinase ChvG [Amphiplicatus metriothermophilus]